MSRVLPFLVLFALALCGVSAAPESPVRYDSLRGLVMAGYQGWFNTPDDGANRSWRHYNGKDGFRPGSCSIDLWPDTREYEKTYSTEFLLPSEKPAYTFSSYDASTVETHFRWMKEYGLDGVFMQRFVAEIAHDSGKRHFDTVLDSALSGSTKYGRAICIMYDLSGMPPDGAEILLKDSSSLSKKYDLKQREKVPGYLFHKGRPLIAVWGIGFNDNRKYGLPEAEKIIDGLHKQGFSVLLGVPAWWRTLSRDAIADPELHRLIRKCEALMPWFVGRYDLSSYPGHKNSIREDIQWCRDAGVDYMPLCFPGFSWRNMKSPDSPQFDRHGGKFFWNQISGAVECGAQSLYIAMFDELDEGTAIFKCLNKKDVPIPQKGTRFEGVEDGLPTDHYLWLSGQAGLLIRKKRENSPDLPERTSSAAPTSSLE